MPEFEPLELTDPLDVVAWLRALPLGTVLLDSRERAWQVRAWCEYTGCSGPREFLALVMAGSEESYQLADDEDVSVVAGEGPFRVLWTPGGEPC